MKINREVVGWSKRLLRERCEHLRKSVEGGVASTEECAAHWPGGAKNPGKDYGAWVYCYGSMRQFLGRDDRPERRTEQLDAALAAALAAEPEAVACDDGATRYVHPKSYHALRWLDTLDRSLVSALDEAARGIDGPAQEVVSTVGPLVESLAVRLWAWVLCTDGAGMPFGDTDDGAEPPAWTRGLSPKDLIGLAAAHVRVNHTRTAIIAQAFPAEPGEGRQSRLSLAGFIGAYADEKGIQAQELMRRWPLGQLFAQRVVAAEQQREAMRRAKEQAA